MSTDSETPRLFIRHFSGFPKLKEDEEAFIETHLFLQASKEVVSAIENFGRLFSPVVHDMQNNIQKITSVFEQNPSKYNNLETLLADEKEQNSNYAGNALLWLTRALELISVFFYNIYNDPEEKNSLKEPLKEAYNKTLKSYHKWIVQSAFALIYSWVPTRQQLFGTDDIYIENMKLLEPLQQRMHLNLQEVKKLIIKYGHDDKTAV